MATIRILVVLSACWLTGQATVTTDQFSAKVSELEAHVTTVEQRNRALESQNQALQRQLDTALALNISLHHALRNASAQSQQHADSLQTLVHSLQNQNRALAYELDALKVQHNQSQGSSNPHVSFHVRMSTRDDATPRSNTPIVMTDVRNNQGHGYDPHTGKFTAPVNGTYCILGSTEAAMNHYAGVFLMLDANSVDYMETSSKGSYQAMSVHMVMKLTAGQQVWLKSNQDSHYWYSPTSFSGFLIDAQ